MTQASAGRTSSNISAEGGSTISHVHIGDRLYQSPKDEPRPAFVTFAFIDDAQFSHFEVTNSGQQPAYNVKLSCFPIRTYSFTSDSIPCVLPGNRLAVKGITRTQLVGTSVERDLGWASVRGITQGAGLEWSIREYFKDYLLGGDLEGEIFVLPEWQLNPSLPATTRGHWHRLTFKPGEHTIATVMPEGFYPPSGPSPPNIKTDVTAQQQQPSPQVDIPVQLRAQQGGIVISVRQMQNREKPLPARIVVSNIRKIKHGEPATDGLFHTEGGVFKYHAIQLSRSDSGAELHYDDVGQWWMVRSFGGRNSLQIFWPDRQVQPNIDLLQGAYIADLVIWVGDKSVPFQATWSIDAQHKATLS